MEVERKFLLESLPSGMDAGTRIEQGYLAIDPAGAEVRVRRKGSATLMTVKTGAGMVRGEEEFGLERELFERLWAMTEGRRSEEHTSELQSHVNLVCRLLLEKKKKQQKPNRN